jgi:hypothetical protein
MMSVNRTLKMKNPGATPRVSKDLRKELQLTQGISRLTLPLHISLHGAPVGPLSHGGHVVAVRPKLAPQEFLIRPNFDGHLVKRVNCLAEVIYVGTEEAD